MSDACGSNAIKWWRWYASLDSLSSFLKRYVHERDSRQVGSRPSAGGRLLWMCREQSMSFALCKPYGSTAAGTTRRTPQLLRSTLTHSLWLLVLCITNYTSSLLKGQASVQHQLLLC